MLLNNFTAGDWETGAGNCHVVYGPKCGGRQRVIARCSTQEGDEDYDSRESGANARLIARAPNLLAELKATETLCLELMKRAAAVDRRLHLALELEQEVELGELTRMRSQLSKNRQVIERAEGVRP